MLVLLQTLLEQELVAGPSHELGLIALGLVALVRPRAWCAKVAEALAAVLQKQSSISEVLALDTFQYARHQHNEEKYMQRLSSHPLVVKLSKRVHENLADLG